MAVNETYGPYQAIVNSIHDGDTATLAVQLSADFGFGITTNTVFVLACRFYGINAPELSTQAGKDALAFLRTVLSVGDTVTVVSYGWDKYGGRFDGVITLADGTNLNQLMVDSGHAVPYPT